MYNQAHQEVSVSKPNSQALLAIGRYSYSSLDLDSIFCFLLFKHTGFPPTNNFLH